MACCCQENCRINYKSVNADHVFDYPPFLGPYGPSVIECICGYRFLCEDEMEDWNSASDEEIDLMTRLTILRNDHYGDHYVDYPYDHIRIIFNPVLSDAENAEMLRSIYGSNERIVKLVSSYRNYYRDDRFKAIVSRRDILLDQLKRISH